MTPRRRLALLSWVGTMTAAGLAIAILIATRETAVPTSWGFRGASELFAITCGSVGAIVALRRPDNLNGWLFCAIGLLFAIEGLVNEYVIVSVLVVAGDLPWTTLLAWTLTWLWVPPLGIALIFLPLFFPTGRLLSPRWRAVVALGVVALAVFSAVVSFEPGPIEQATFVDNPLAVPGMDVATYSSKVLGPIWILLTAAIGLSLASLVIRFRRASGDARQQIKWFALAALIAGIAFALYLFITVIAASASAVKALEIVVIVTLLGLPAAAGMAILRYRLYDIDRIVSRTIAYGLITGVLVGAYAALILLLQGPLGQFTGGDTLSVAISTLVVAALFQPLRRGVQSIVDHRFDRARYDAVRIALAFSERLRSETDMEIVTTDLGRTARQTVAPTTMTIWLRRRETIR